MVSATVVVALLGLWRHLLRLTLLARVFTLAVPAPFRRFLVALFPNGPGLTLAALLTILVARVQLSALERDIRIRRRLRIPVALLVADVIALLLVLPLFEPALMKRAARATPVLSQG